MKMMPPRGRVILQLRDPLQIILKVPLTVRGEQYAVDDIVTLEKRIAVGLARSGQACVAPGGLDPKRSKNLFIVVSENTGLITAENVEQAAESSRTKKRKRGN